LSLVFLVVSMVVSVAVVVIVLVGRSVSGDSGLGDTGF
jgi:preprotein translocase subunit SecG